MVGRGLFHCRIAAVGAVFALTAAMRAQCLGIMPVYDASSESIGEQFTEQATLMLYQDLSSRSIAATLLNPGGVYLTTDLDLISGYAAQSHCTYVLVTTLQQVERPPRGKRGDWFLIMSAALFQASSGSAIDLGPFRIKIKPEELIVETWHGHFWGTTGSRPFNKQPMGHVAERIVNQIVTAALAYPALASSPPAPKLASAPSPTPCNATFRVSFPKTGRVSKAYDLLMDGSDESIKIDEGIAPLSITPGEHLFLLHIADPPYKVPMQHQYAFNLTTSCAAPNIVAVLDSGGGVYLKMQ